ncbi:ParA family protein [Desulfonema magnum]|uniref:AAA ATPase-like domain-containing protein n=1 Tax=Desulfonema magnum TaxID=45655 RepID=A0A975BM10_9BACT|nr:ParA family protein [Desulfonema magnum]QTA88027.1 AAA ATPase-like domain-containing protein [Desulfonema magnum]
MTRFIIFANRKGGCGKTTTAVNVAHALAKKEKKILLVDVDPQAHASLSVGNAPGIQYPTIFHLLRGEVSLKHAIVRTHLDGVSLIPSSRDLIAFETEFSSQKRSEMLLSEKLTGDIGDFDYLIFDPPPTAGLLTISALAAAQEVYIPMQMHFLNLEGLAEMVRLVYDVNAAWNPNLRMEGIIPTFFNKTTRIAKEIADDIIRHFGKDRLFPGIRMNISLSEAPGHGKSIFEYAPGSTGASDYMKLADKIDSVNSYP